MGEKIAKAQTALVIVEVKFVPAGGPSIVVGQSMTELTCPALNRATGDRIAGLLRSIVERGARGPLWAFGDPHLPGDSFAKELKRAGVRCLRAWRKSWRKAYNEEIA